METVYMAELARPSNLTPSQLFQLNFIYHIDISQFVVLYDSKRYVLYVNVPTPTEDIEKFLIIANYSEPAISDPDCPIAPIVNYVYDKYGLATWHCLLDAQKHREQALRMQKAQAEAGKIMSLLQATLRNGEEEGRKEPGVLCRNEELISCIYVEGSKQKGCNGGIGNGLKYVFLFAYMAGAGGIHLN